MREEFRRGDTEVGVQMAPKLSSGADLRDEEVLRVSKYLPRHAGDNLEETGKDGDAPSNGNIAWMLWGGDAGRTWSARLEEELEANT